MALSQVQCLDDNHVNPRTHEAKPEFLYCEDQRLALEAFLRDGREAFLKYLGARGMRGFLSDPELDSFAEAVEPYDPGAEVFPEDAGDDEPPLSLHYWPELSDTSVPRMDLGWPDNVSYRGVTRTTVYTQPPLEGAVHIKEVVRKMIAQAHKVIAVVMDVFTDVDIFRDLLDAGFKKKVSVYILLEHTALPHFQSMCQRANMHAGHLKHLRVRCTYGSEFYTRSCTKIRGRMGHRFMFIDGDKAVSGSYSFTWMSSRLDRNLITVVSGQAVESFDRLFRVLYATSSSVDLRQVATEPEPELEPLPQPVVLISPAAIARKLYSPKYALVALSNLSPTPSADPKDTQNPEDSKDPETRKQRRACKDALMEVPPIHPGLDLEKACMISYLPIWPEPDPPSDVIGFINIRDAKRPNQVHLQRSEMFETSQAIRFSSPFSMPKETLPEVAKPRQLTSEHKETKNLQPGQDKSKSEESAQPSSEPGVIKSKAEAPGQKSPASEPKCESDKDATKTLNHVTTSTVNGAPLVSIRSSSIPRLTSSSTPKPPLPSSSVPSSSSTPPIPKPRTVQLVMKGGTCDGEFTVVRKETNKDVQNNSGIKAAAQKDTLKVGRAAEKKQSGTSQEAKNEEAEGRRKRAGMQLMAGNKAKSESLIADGPKAERGNIQGIISKDEEPKSSASADCELGPRTECAAAAQTEIKAAGRASTDCENVTESKTYLARAHAPQRISYCESTPQQIGVSEADSPNTAAQNAHGIFQEQTPQAQQSAQRPKRPLRSATPEREPRPLKALARTPTPDGFLPQSPTPESRRHPSDPRTPDFRTPTSDGFSSPRPDSALSGTSEEYYECSDSPFRESFFERAASPNKGTTEDRVGNATTGPEYVNSTACAAPLATTDSSGSETQSLSRPASVSSLSSLNGKEVKDVVSEENGREEDESVERRCSEDAKRTADSTEPEEEHREARSPKTQRGLNQSPVDEGGTPGELANERKELKRLSAGEAQPKKVSPERKRPEKEKTVEGTALGPSGVERTDRSQSARETEGRKLTPKAPRGKQQDTGAASPSRPSRPTRALSTGQASGPRPRVNRQPNHAGSLQSLDSSSSPRRPPSRPPPPATAGSVGSASGRKQAEVSRQPLAAQGRTRAAPPQNQHSPPKPQASSLLTHSNKKAQNETASPREDHWQEKEMSPFSFTFSRLYSLKGLKDKVSKLPGQSKRGGAGSPGQRRKSTS